MSERPEKLYLSAPDADQEHEIWFDPDEGGTEYVRADRIAALEAQLAERVKVKPLEWNECKFGGVLSFDAKVGFGDLEYSLQSYDDGTWGWFTSFRTERGYSGCMGKGLTLEVAKAAAQADYAGRILSALEATPPAPKVTEGHPMQPVIVSEHGIHRFKSNKCVEALLDHGQKTGFALNELARQEHTAEDRMQLAQLIGYSVSGYGDLSYVSDASYDLAAKQSQTLTAAQEAGKP